MRKLFAISTALALAAASVVWAQPPAKVEPPPVPKAPPAKADPTKKPADPTDAAIAAALAHDADVKMARAKIQLAEAELAKAKFLVTQKVVTAHVALRDARAAVLAAEQQVEAIFAQLRDQRVPNAQDRSDYRLALSRVESAKSKLAFAETEWKLLTGAGRAAEGGSSVEWFFERFRVPQPHADAHFLAEAFEAAILLDVVRAKPPVGPVSDRIRAALDKPVKLGAKGKAVQVADAVDVFKRSAGLDVPVRGADALEAVLEISGEELPVGAWFQLFQDELGFTVYVREYGLLFAKKGNAPADAVTLTEFWKQKPGPAPKK